MPLLTAINCFSLESVQKSGRFHSASCYVCEVLKARLVVGTPIRIELGSSIEGKDRVLPSSRQVGMSSKPKCVTKRSSTGTY